MSTIFAMGGLHEPLAGIHLAADACRERIADRRAALIAAGLRPGDRALIHHGNSVSYFIDVLAIWTAGACAVPVDPRLSDGEAAAVATAAKARCSLFDRDPGATLAAALRDLGIVTVTDRTGAWASGPDESPVAADSDALILFTSGTTGTPKGVVHTHASLQARWRIQREALGSACLERTLFMLPSGFAFGLIGNALYAWLSGAELYVTPAFRTDVMLQLGTLCDELDITFLPTVPALWRVVLRTVAPPKKGSLRRIACGTSPLPERLWNDIRAWSGIEDVMNVYSMTECGMLATHSAQDGEPFDGLVGRPFRGVDIRIVPPGVAVDEVLRAGACLTETAGAVWARTPTLMRGYFGRDDLTREAVRDGWFCTGDLGSLNADGRLVLRGRDKDMINVGGVKVYPLDVDLALGRCPLVQDVCAFPVDDPMQGEQVAVAVVARPPPERHQAAIFRHAETELAPFQLPRRWYFVDEIPRTTRGKLNRDAVARSCAGRTAVDARALAAATRLAPPAGDAG